MPQIFNDYLITLGWAIVGSVSMGVSLIITLEMLTLFTLKMDEEQELAKNNVAVAIVIAAIVLACAWVVSSVIRP